MTKSNDRNNFTVSLDGLTFTRVIAVSGKVAYIRHNADGTTNNIINIAPICDRIDAAIIEAAHAEALEMNEEITFLKNLSPLNADQAVIYIAQCGFWAANDSVARGELVEQAHAEALDINAAIDLIIDERQQIADCEYSDAELTARFKSLGYGLPSARLGADFEAYRHKAVILWANGFVTYPPEECDPEYIACAIDCRQQWVHFG